MFNSVGLDRIRQCSFDDPVLCGLGDASGAWRRGTSDVLSQYIHHDADWDKSGNNIDITSLTNCELLNVYSLCKSSLKPVK